MSDENEELNEHEDAGDEDVKDPAAVIRLARKKDRENATLKTRLDEQATELERLKAFEEDQKTTQQKLIDAAREEGLKEATDLFEVKLMKERVRSRAAVDFSDPDDVVSILKLDSLTDDDSIDDALVELAKSKPYLVRSGDAPKDKSIDQGPRGTRVKGAQKSDANSWLRDAISGN